MTLDKNGKMIGGGDIKTQARTVLANINCVLAVCDAKLADVTMSHVFTIDLANFKAMKEVYLEFFDRGTLARLAFVAIS